MLATRLKVELGFPICSNRQHRFLALSAFGRPTTRRFHVRPYLLAIGIPSSMICPNLLFNLVRTARRSCSDAGRSLRLRRHEETDDRQEHAAPRCRGGASRSKYCLKTHQYQKSTTAPHAVEIKVGFRDPPCPFRCLGVRVGAGDPVRHRLDLRRQQGVRENWNIQAMSKCVLRRASLSRRGLGPGARFRVGAIGALLAVAGQDGAAPPTSPVSTSRNSAS